MSPGNKPLLEPTLSMFYAAFWANEFTIIYLVLSWSRCTIPLQAKQRSDYVTKLSVIPNGDMGNHGATVIPDMITCLCIVAQYWKWWMQCTWYFWNAVPIPRCAYGCPKLEFRASQHGGGPARLELSQCDSVVVTRLQWVILAVFGHLMRIFVQATDFLV